MVIDLTSTIKLNVDKASLDGVKALRKEIASIEQALKSISSLKVNIPSIQSPIKTPTAPSAPTGDTQYLKKYREELSLARTEALLYGREKDNLRKKLEDEGKSQTAINAVLNQHAKDSVAAKNSTQALAQARDYLNKITDKSINIPIFSIFISNKNRIISFKAHWRFAMYLHF